MEYRYEAFIIDEETDNIVASIETHSQESLEEEMGKSKWTKATERYEDGNVIPDSGEEDDDKFQTKHDNDFADEMATRSNAVQDSGFMGVVD